MRVFVFGTRGFPGVQGGVEKHCENLYPLISSQFEFTVFRRKPYMKNNTNNFHIKFIDLPSTKIKGFEAFIHSFLCAVFCIIKRPSLIHIHNIGPGMFIPLLKTFRLKVILTYHSPNYEHKKWNLFSRNILKLSEYLAIKWADKIIFVNQFQMRSFNLEIQNKSIYIPNGINIVPPNLKTNYIHSIGLTSKKYILFVGRITQEKGIDYLIDAFELSKVLTYKLVLAGGIDHYSNYAKLIEQKAKKASNIIMTGYVDGDDLRQLYSHAKLFILPSHNEGFPLVLLEAMNYNLDILASDIPANKLICLNNHNYFKTGDKNDLAQHIQQKVKEQNQKQEYSTILNNFSWDYVAKETEKVFTSFLK